MNLTVISVELVGDARAAAYRAALCVGCGTRPHRAGCLECDTCWSVRTGRNPNPAPRVYSPNMSVPRIRPADEPDHENDCAAWSWADPATWPDGITELNASYREHVAGLPHCGCGQSLLAPISIDRGHCEVCERSR